MIGGIAGNYAGYSVETPPDQQTLGGSAKASVMGAIQGAASWAIARGSGKLLGKVGSTVGGRLASKLAAKAGSDGESAVAKLASKAAGGGEDAGEGAVAGGGKAGAKSSAPNESEPASAGSDGEKGLHVALGRNNPLVEMEFGGVKTPPIYWKDSLREFAHERNALTQHDSEFNDLKGLGPSEYARAIVDRAVTSGGRISFSLRGVDAKSILGGEDGGYTAHELRYICGHSVALSITTFFHGSAPC
ncbi:hypothetical protein [Actinomadura sp. DC4]|uniref:hypothetical protein n=1 Tax=Actinomadura sp. DC4 TaxID=3055069 RepID=UPI0025B1A0AC|nr:hypothetical protein [Actinomadura sp. DC4]MDN3360064.1 hypothetical protein [Actinomadura sp. DC4]